MTESLWLGRRWEVDEVGDAMRGTPGRAMLVVCSEDLSLTLSEVGAVEASEQRRP